MQQIIEGKFRLAVSEAILQEIRGILRGRKFQYPPQLTHTILSEIESMSYLIQPTAKIHRITKDPDDNKFIECAAAADADFIISGDIHLLELGTYKGIQIITPADFLSIL
jgi:putative PIN family toxin of toxin-antitoxin system